jgi:DNA helicase II / ATP-dependent DNA helicase PcrA
MTFIADLHIHSHFSRATSQDLIPEDLSLWAQKKGIALIGTGDFTHPGWVSELREKLVEAESGLYRLKPDLEISVQGRIPANCKAPIRFILSGEISCIYKRGGKTRKVHNLVLLPNFDAVQELNKRLQRIGNITSDGRPILGLDSRNLLEIVLEVSDRSFFIPAHIWTPWFSLFGSKSGFDSIEECFGDLSPHIYALETGLSSDPPMNRLLSCLDPYVLVSNSDAHSSPKLGREANIFEVPLDYDLLMKAMREKEGFQGTIEFFPEEGKYHLDGHRKCQICFHPSETKKHQGLCPVCRKPLTVGVLHRVHELSDRDEPKLSKAFSSLIPLGEILGEILDCGPTAKKVLSFYEDLLTALGPELHILMNAPLHEIERAGGPLLREAIVRMRGSRVIRQEGYDGEYGVIRLFEEAEKRALCGQEALFSLPKKQTRQKNAPVGQKESRIEKSKPGPCEPTGSPDSILAPLNERQKEAVLHEGGHLLIIAGPGTGKTLTLTHRIAHQIQSGKASPEKVLALTFTNKAAGEMKNRMTSLLSENPAKKIRVFTFHAFCLEVLREDGERIGLPPDFTLCSEADAAMIAQTLVSDSKTRKGSIQAFPRKLSQLKTASALSVKEDPSDHELLPLLKEYQERLRRMRMLDLDDLEVETFRVFQKHPDVSKKYSERFPWIFVDEYQDTNPIQVQILKALVRHDLHGTLNPKPCPPIIDLSIPQVSPCTLNPAPCTPCICAIGDPDQAIYGFRGSDVTCFHRFEEDFPGTKKLMLSRNYRSTQTILDGAASLMQKDKALEASRDEGDPIRFASCRTEKEEAEMIVEQIEKLIGGTSYFSLDSGRVSSHENGANLGFGDIAVLYRLNAQGEAFEEAFSRAGIPFVRSGEKPLISQFPVNILWRFLQTRLYPENPHYLEAYTLCLRQKGLSSPLIGEDKGGGKVASVSTLIEHALSLHQFGTLSAEGLNALNRLKAVAHDFTDVESFLDALSLDRGIDHSSLLGDRVALMSLHAAKGLEWPVVFITGCEDGLIPCTLFGDKNDEEEKRLFYVGMTRARNSLILSHANHRMINTRHLELKRSPFLSLIPERLIQAVERSGWKQKKKPHKQLSFF